jgi:hypothetical protein
MENVFFGATLRKIRGSAAAIAILSVLIPSALIADARFSITGIATGFDASSGSESSGSFTALTDRPANRASESQTITISGLSGPETVTVSGHASTQIRIDGGSLASSGTISNGQTLSISLFPTSWNTTITGSVTIGSADPESFSVTTAPAPTVDLVSSSIPDGDVGSAYNGGSGFNFGTLASFTGGSTSEPPVPGDLSWSLTGLPAGMTFDVVTGVLAGTPTSEAEGDNSITVTATLEAGITDSETYSLLIFEDPLVAEGGGGGGGGGSSGPCTQPGDICADGTTFLAGQTPGGNYLYAQPVSLAARRDQADTNCAAIGAGWRPVHTADERNLLAIPGDPANIDGVTFWALNEITGVSGGFDPDIGAMVNSCTWSARRYSISSASGDGNFTLHNPTGTSSDYFTLGTVQTQNNCNTTTPPVNAQTHPYVCIKLEPELLP